MEPKKILIILSLVLVMSIALVSAGIAHAGGIQGIRLLGVLFFLTFGVVVALAQLIPAGILLLSFIGASFFPLWKDNAPVRPTWD
jgi:hypothetical protein